MDEFPLPAGKFGSAPLLVCVGPLECCFCVDEDFVSLDFDDEVVVALSKKSAGNLEIIKKQHTVATC